MRYIPQFSYFISPGETPISQNSALWRQPLPLSRHLSEKPATISMCLGEYFRALRTFFVSDGYRSLCRALTQRLQQDIKPQDICEIRIGLEKHGEFYHPARIKVLARHQKISLVLNVAVSETGIETIKKEYHCLSKLNDQYPLCFLPEVYGFGEVELAGDRKIRMFLGHWFEGYNEFHIARDPSDNNDKILVWDDLRKRFYLSLEQSADLYRQAARILTYYYNIESFEHIFSWHHAAGDFVVKTDNGDLDLKLITVRGYTPLLDNLSNLNNGEKDVELMLQVLLIFFLNLSIRMRLDRLDGVGDIIWANRLAVKSTLAGFLEGLAQKPHFAFMPDSIYECFRYYLSVCTKEDLYELSKGAINTFSRQAPEVQVIKQHLTEHIEELTRVIGQQICR